MDMRPITFAICAEGAFTVKLEAEVELPDSTAHYHVKNIHRAGNHHKDHIIPDISIKCIVKSGKRMWVHIDSNLPSDLSTSIGSCLEKILPHIETAAAGDAIEKGDLSVAAAT